MGAMRERGGPVRIGADTGIRIGMTTEAIAQGAFGTVAPLVGPDIESLSESTSTIEAYAMMDSYDDNRKVWYAWVSNAWCILGGEC